MPTERRAMRVAVAVVAAGLVAGACTVEPSVEVERAVESVGDLLPDRDSFERPTDSGNPPSAPSTVPPSASESADEPVSPSGAGGSIAWGPCEEFAIPPTDQLGTERWECGRLEVAMNPDDSDGGLPPVSLALTRHPATGTRFGTILLNPGGPGGAGLPLAWNLRPGLPTELLRGFDIVAWDPRGIGRSEPTAGCPADADPADVDFIERCVETTGPLSAFISAPYSVADIEAIRVALGEDRLDYVGYSYGTILGALYAERFPDHVGSFTLDGATDPDVGSEAGPVEGVFPTFADDGFPAALGRFEEICAATTRCLDGLDPSTVIGDLRDVIAELPTDAAPSGPSRLDETLLDELLARSMGSAVDWELLAAALSAAHEGDGSLLAALLVDLGIALPSPDGDDGNGSAGGGGSDPFDNFEAANFLIYCADLAPFVTIPQFCDAMPESAEPLGPIQPVDLDRDLLVIGTEFDPLTPGYHAEEFADRLGEAVWITWEGVGHTAFPGWTDCIDDVVTQHHLGNALPASGIRCSFLEGVVDDAELGEVLFGFDLTDGRGWLGDALGDRGLDTELVSCVVDRLVPDDDVDDRLVSELILDVGTDTATAALDAAIAAC